MGASEPKQLHDQFAKFFNSQDIDGLLSLYEEDAVLSPGGGAVVRGKDGIRESLQAFLAMGGTIEFLGATEPLVNGKLALTHGRWRITPGSGDAMEGVTAELARLDDDGEWRYVIDNPFGSAGL